MTSLSILVANTVIHYYTSSLTAVTALKALDNEFEAVSASLKVPFYRTLLRMTVPGVPAGDTRYRPLLLRGRHGDPVLGRVPVFSGHDSRRHGDHVYGRARRGRRGRSGRGARHAHRRDLGGVCLLYALATRVLLARTQAWRTPQTG